MDSGFFVPNGLLGIGSGLSFSSSLTSTSKILHSEEDSTAASASLNSGTNDEEVLDHDDMTLKTKGQSFDPKFGTGLLSTLKSSAQTASPEPVLRNTTNTFESGASFTSVLTLPRLGASSSSLGRASAHITATSYDGKSISFRKRPKSKTDIQSSSKRNYSSLLETPLHRLMDNMAASTSSLLSQQEHFVPRPDPTSTVPTELWVDRYRPKRFTDLLGDERIHRETLSWLKEWDHCVFRRKRPKRQKKDNELNGHQIADDAYHRPREKLLLLSGPPGLGKTTLAHVIARQAGYDVMEINASDSRSALTIDDRLKPTLEAGSLIGSKRPVCVIVDEIDGATGGGEHTSGFVHKLIQLTFDQPNKKRGKRDPKGGRPLLRPIICICNDLYATSLAKLRQHARVIRFNRPADVHLIKRLRQICEIEGLRTDSRALTALVGVAKGDLRGCLNTLQFIKARNEDVTESIIRSATVGMKEADTSSYSVLNDIFTPMSKKRVQDLGLDGEGEIKYVYRLSRDIDASGSIDKVAWGCFEHYTNLKQFDATLGRYESANEWLSAYDLFSGNMYNEQNYAVMPYLSYLLVPFHPLFHERAGPKIENLKHDWENFTKTKVNEEIYDTFSRCTLAAGSHRWPGLRHLLSNEVMQLELAPLINRIISPPLRPINSQIIKPEERKILSRLVDIMVSFDLRFVQERTEEGQLAYRLDPPVDVFVTYDGKRAVDIPASRYGTRQIVAAEIDAKLITLQAEATEKGKGTSTLASSFFNENKRTTVIEGETTEGMDWPPPDGKLLDSGANGPVAQRKRKSDSMVDPVDKPPVDFFGRPIITKVESKSTDPDQRVAKPFKVSYKFHEGNSAAVRKPVKLASLL